MKIYVASSWRNERQATVVERLRFAGHEVYDFKNPAPGNNGFHWREIDEAWREWTPQQFVEALEHPVAIAGFASDFGAMRWADACVLVLPCGRSAHIEAGYFVGAGKPLFILNESAMEPELMYSMASEVCTSLEQVLKELSDCRRVFEIPSHLERVKR